MSSVCRSTMECTFRETADMEENRATITGFAALLLVVPLLDGERVHVDMDNLLHEQAKTKIMPTLH